MNHLQKIVVLLAILSLGNTCLCLKLNRVICATDTNPEYIQFWPITARAWAEIVGVRPTLALIAGPEVSVDESIGDVIRFDPIPGVPTSLQAQTIRLLLPSLFENDTCIISDIDLFPLQKRYFEKHIKKASNNSFVVYRDQAYGHNAPRFPMCYMAAKGRTFKELFGGGSKEVITEIIKEWNKLGYGWNTDELILTETLKHWSSYNSRCIRLGHRAVDRVDRGQDYNYKALFRGKYIDCHAPRPYLQHKEWIDGVLKRYHQSQIKNKKRHRKKHTLKKSRKRPHKK